MDLFSCANCIHNPAQGLTVGRGAGFCLQWGSLVEHPEQTTCKYLHRKDLPAFLVRDAALEHVDELADTRGMVELYGHAAVPLQAPEPGTSTSLDPATQVVVSYHTLDSAADLTADRRGELNALFSRSIDGRLALLHACLLRRGMLGAASWRARKELVVALLEEVDSDLFFNDKDLLGPDSDEARAAARWEVAYARLSGIQEFGWHSADDRLKHPLRELGAHVAADDWPGFLGALARLKEGWIRAVEGADPLTGTTDIVTVPVVGRIAAGLPLQVRDDLFDTVRIERGLVDGGHGVFGLRVEGESMIEAGILGGDYLFVHKHRAAQRGDIVVVLLGEETTVKYFYPEEDYVRLQPANAKMSPILVRTGDFRPEMVLGVVIGVYRKTEHREEPLAASRLASGGQR